MSAVMAPASARHDRQAEALLRSEIDAFNADYAAALDARRFDDWPTFFMPDARYVVQGRENFDRRLPLALIALESRAMMEDRVYGITQTIYHAPYYTRHVVGVCRLIAGPADGDGREDGAVRATKENGAVRESKENGAVRAEANYAVFRTRPGDASEVYNVGRYIDEFVRDESGNLKLGLRRCIYDSEMVLNSLIYPI